MNRKNPNQNETRTVRHVMHGLEHEEVCFDCGTPGELLECDECPRVFHLDCINIDDVPEKM